MGPKKLLSITESYYSEFSSNYYKKRQNKHKQEKKLTDKTINFRLIKELVTLLSWEIIRVYQKAGVPCQHARMQKCKMAKRDCLLSLAIASWHH